MCLLKHPCMLYALHDNVLLCDPFPTVLRQKLATVFDACIGARRCKPHCDHRYKSDHPAVFGTNLFFGLLSVFHLAYLGVMFDAAPQLQEQGYSMSHTLSKWSELKFASHWVALATFLFYLLV